MMTNPDSNYGNMTIREFFAAAALMGSCADSHCAFEKAEEFAEFAVGAADELIIALNKPPIKE